MEDGSGAGKIGLWICLMEPFRKENKRVGRKVTQPAFERTFADNIPNSSLFPFCYVSGVSSSFSSSCH